MTDWRVLKHLYILFFLAILPTVIKISRRVDLDEFLLLMGAFVTIWGALVFLLDPGFFQILLQKIRGRQLTVQRGRSRTPANEEF